jgi:hypothetical protein
VGHEIFNDPIADISFQHGSSHDIETIAHIAFGQLSFSG